MRLNKEIKEIISQALAEDRVRSDVTTKFSLPKTCTGEAVIIAKQSGVLCGGDVAREVFRQGDPTLNFELLISDSSSIDNGHIIARIKGD